jgi:DNA-binding LacI/PurR family transcriptional regulator
MMPTRTTAQEKIKLQLLQELGSKWPVGSKLPPITELARALNAGHRNTFMALQELAREGYVQSKRKAGTLVIKAPALSSAPAAASSQPRTTIAILCPAPTATAISGPIIEAFAQTMDRLGHKVEVLVARPKEYDLTARRYAGFGAVAMIQPEVAPITLRKDQPAVIIQTTASLVILGNGNYDIVAPDEEYASSLAGIQFRLSGCSSAAFVGVARPSHPNSYDAISQARLRGFEAGWGEPIPQTHQFMTRCYGEGSGARCVMDYQCLTRRPDAIFAASDELAIGFAMGAMAMGFEPSRDYQLIGFDAQPKGREISGLPPLTSISVPLADMGRRGGQLLSSRLANPTKRLERVLMSCDIHLGQSVRTSALIPSN